MRIVDGFKDHGSLPPVGQKCSLLPEVPDAGYYGLSLVDQFVNRALELADHVYVLRRGEIVKSGTPDHLRGSDIVSQYLGTGEVQ